jgi:DNA-binding Lrp family transcriptional regulator
VIDYQNKHHGLSPTDLMISKGTNLSAGQVQYQMKQMEEAGLIKDYNRRGSPRRIEVKDAVKVQDLSIVAIKPKAEKATEVIMDTKEQKLHAGHGPLGPTGRKGFMARALEVAEAIQDHWDHYGVSPNGNYIKERVYSRTTNGGGLSRVVKKMVDLGWLMHRYKSQSYVLTGLGRAALFGQQEETLHTDTPVHPKPPEPQLSEALVEAGYKGKRGMPRGLGWGYGRTIPRDLPRAGVAVEVRRETPPPPMPKPAPVMDDEAPTPYISDMDLVLELTRRGFKVSR